MKELLPGEHLGGGSKVAEAICCGCSAPQGFKQEAVLPFLCPGMRKGTGKGRRNDPDRVYLKVRRL